MVQGRSILNTHPQAIFMGRVFLMSRAHIPDSQGMNIYISQFSLSGRLLPYCTHPHYKSTVIIQVDHWYPQVSGYSKEHFLLGQSTQSNSHRKSYSGHLLSSFPAGIYFCSYILIRYFMSDPNKTHLLHPSMLQLLCGQLKECKLGIKPLSLHNKIKNHSWVPILLLI